MCVSAHQKVIFTFSTNKHLRYHNIRRWNGWNDTSLRLRFKKLPAKTINLRCILGKNKRLSNKKILLLEAGKAMGDTLSSKFSNRVSALNPRTHQLLKEIGAWKHISRFAPVLKLQVSLSTTTSIYIVFHYS